MYAKFCPAGSHIVRKLAEYEQGAPNSAGQLTKRCASKAAVVRSNLIGVRHQPIEISREATQRFSTDCELSLKTALTCGAGLYIGVVPAHFLVGKSRIGQASA
jgi:hypothetical protein